MTLVAQPYPSVVGWQELAGHYRNGWADRIKVSGSFPRIGAAA